VDLCKDYISKEASSPFGIWALHSDAYDFAAPNGSSSGSRKVFASNLAHLGLVLFWISGMSFHGAYFSNYIDWIKDKDNVAPTSHLVWELVGQGVLNSDLGGLKEGIRITSGLFQVWLSEGIVSISQLKSISAASMVVSFSFLIGAFIKMHLLGGVANKKFKTILPHHLCILLGLGSLSWSGHQIHISGPLTALVE
jgi:photosystem I P700 chlorophyll a apoprotein A1